MNTFVAALKRDLLAHTRHPADVLNPLVFFMIVISLFPLGIGPSKETLHMIAPGVVWVAALLATLMSMDLLFKSDYEDGSLEQMLVAQAPLLPLVFAKIASHWLVSGLPLVIMTPLISLTYYLDAAGMFVMTLSLLLVSPSLSLLGAIGAALTVSLSRGGLIVAILILPLYVPVLILATAMVQTGMDGGDYLGYVFWLVAILSLSLGLAPLATSFSLRVSLEH